MVERRASGPRGPRHLTPVAAGCDPALEELAARVLHAVRRIPRPAGPHGRADGGAWSVLVSAGMAEDTPVLVLATRQGIDGLAFPPDRRFPASLVLGGRVLTVRGGELPGVGHYYLVRLAAGAAQHSAPDCARAAGGPLAEPFRAATARVRRSVLLHPSNQPPTAALGSGDG